MRCQQCGKELSAADSSVCEFCDLILSRKRGDPAEAFESCCPSCNRRLSIPYAAIGSKGKCKRCHATISIGAPNISAVDHRAICKKAVMLGHEGYWRRALAELAKLDAIDIPMNLSHIKDRVEGLKRMCLEQMESYRLIEGLDRATDRQEPQVGIDGGEY